MEKNYIKQLEREVAVQRQRAVALKQGLIDLIRYCDSEKFHCDQYVHVSDVITRAAGALCAGTDLWVESSEMFDIHDPRSPEMDSLHRQAIEQNAAFDRMRVKRVYRQYLDGVISPYELFSMIEKAVPWVRIDMKTYAVPADSWAVDNVTVMNDRTGDGNVFSIDNLSTDDLCKRVVLKVLELLS